MTGKKQGGKTQKPCRSPCYESHWLHEPHMIYYVFTPAPSYQRKRLWVPHLLSFRMEVTWKAMHCKAPAPVGGSCSAALSLESFGFLPLKASIQYKDTRKSCDRWCTEMAVLPPSPSTLLVLCSYRISFYLALSLHSGSAGFLLFRHRHSLPRQGKQTPVTPDSQKHL